MTRSSCPLRPDGAQRIGMEEPEPQETRVPHANSNLATRAASLGLAGVVLCLAAFSIFGAYTIQTQIARAQHAESLHATYDRAIIAIRAEHSSVVEYLLAPSAQRRGAMDAATTHPPRPHR